MSEFAVITKDGFPMANFHLADYLSKRLFRGPDGNYVVCLPKALLQEVTLLTFKQFLEPEADDQSEEQFAQTLLKEIFNIFYQYSGVKERLHKAESGCLYLGPGEPSVRLPTAPRFEAGELREPEGLTFNFHPDKKRQGAKAAPKERGVAEAEEGGGASPGEMPEFLH